MPGFHGAGLSSIRYFRDEAGAINIEIALSSDITETCHSIRDFDGTWNHVKTSIICPVFW